MRKLSENPIQDEFIVTDETMIGGRLDVVLSALLPGYSRSALSRLIKADKVRIGEGIASASERIKLGDRIRIGLDIVKHKGLSPRVIWSNDEAVFVDKPAGLLAQGRSEMESEYCVGDYLIEMIKDPNIKRNGLVHRLDRCTSGVIVWALDEKTRLSLVKQFANRTIKKEYLALIAGSPQANRFELRSPIARNLHRPTSFAVRSTGRAAVTEVEVMGSSSDNRYSLLRVMPKTGRTHQIRVHLAHLGLPIIGDQRYGSLYQMAGQGRIYLHALSLEVRLPIKGRVKVIAPLARDMREFLKDHGMTYQEEQE